MANFAERTFGIKAKPLRRAGGFVRDFAERTFGIKAKPAALAIRRFFVFCRKNIWNQGKAVTEHRNNPDDFAERTFGIKAKLTRHEDVDIGHFAERTFGIKAKLALNKTLIFRDFAERTFGIKAKLHPFLRLIRRNFAERTFGIKAKLMSRRPGIGSILPKEHLESRQSCDEFC